jgi:hypothetical protein
MYKVFSSLWNKSAVPIPSVATGLSSVEEDNWVIVNDSGEMIVERVNNNHGSSFSCENVNTTTTHLYH